MVLVYLRRAVTVVDCTRYCGLPTRTACLVLCLIATAFNVFSFYFLPDGVYYVFMTIAGCLGLLGLVAVFSRFRLVTTLFIIFETLLLIPLFIVMGFVGYIAVDQECGYSIIPCSVDYSDYECDLCLYFSQGFLWTGFTASIVAVIVISMMVPGLRKLRVLQAGSTTYNQPIRGAHIHTVQQNPVFVQQAQPTVTTTYTTYPTVVPAAPVNPTMVYTVQQEQPPPYQEASRVYPNIDGSFQNPAMNPDYSRIVK